ncbi:MAG: beta-ketoacyl-[acyl-carrier-protein] synthase family protein [Acidimicrobiales bacterium]
MLRRVAVTGLGVVANCGVGADAFWRGLLDGVPEHGFGIADFDPVPFFDNPKEARRSDSFTHYALAAADEALTQAGPLTADPAKTGVWVGTGVGGIETLEAQIENFLEKGPRRVSPFLVPMMMANAAPASISMKYGFQGPCENTVTACAAGTQSIGRAADLIKLGKCDAVIAGSSEAARSPVARQGFINMTAISSEGVSRPFDLERDGFMHSEGAGILVLEDWEMAQQRGATILAEVLGSGSTADAHHITAPSPGGAGAVRSMELAMEDAGISASDVAYINAHGTSTPLNDAAEAEAVAKVFGSSGPPMSSTKGVTGHALGAAGAIEAVAVVLAMQHRLLPPTHGFATPDPEMPEVNLIVGEPLEWTPGPVLSNSFGFGGHNGTLVIGPGT